VTWKIKVLSEPIGGTGKSGETEKGNSGALEGLFSRQTPTGPHRFIIYHSHIILKFSTFRLPETPIFFFKLEKSCLFCFTL
jgi:hypothetical protein